MASSSQKSVRAFGDSIRAYIRKNPSVLANLGVVDERYHAAQLVQHMEWLQAEAVTHLGESDEFAHTVLGKTCPAIGSLNALREELLSKLARISCYLEEHTHSPLWIPPMEIQDYGYLALILSHYILMGDPVHIHYRMGLAHSLLRPLHNPAPQLALMGIPNMVMVRNTQNGQVMTLMEWLFYEAMYGNGHTDLVHFAACCVYNLLCRTATPKAAREMVLRTDPRSHLRIEGVYFVVDAGEEARKDCLPPPPPPKGGDPFPFNQPLPVTPFAIRDVLPASTYAKQQLLMWIEIRLYHRLDMGAFLTLFQNPSL